MRIAISNIAWRADEEPELRELLAARGLDALEVAPSKIGPRPGELTPAELGAYRAAWAARGIEIVAMQALLFGRGELKLFGTREERAAFVEYLGRIVRLGGVLGARALVFGSPKNRLRGALDDAAVVEQAREVFGALGALAHAAGTCLCIEPNPPEYGADWIHSAREAARLVDDVVSPGFGLHLDAAALWKAGEGAREIAALAPRARHFHASEFELAPLGPGTAVPHAEFAAALRDAGYARVVSIEMRQAEATASNRPHVERALDFVQRVYGD